MPPAWKSDTDFQPIGLAPSLASSLASPPDLPPRAGASIWTGVTVETDSTRSLAASRTVSITALGSSSMSR